MRHTASGIFKSVFITFEKESKIVRGYPTIMEQCPHPHRELRECVNRSAYLRMSGLIGGAFDAEARSGQCAIGG